MIILFENIGFAIFYKMYSFIQINYNYERHIFF